jgi:hypothetical protein
LVWKQKDGHSVIAIAKNLPFDSLNVPNGYLCQAIVESALLVVQNIAAKAISQLQHATISCWRGYPGCGVKRFPFALTAMRSFVSTPQRAMQALAMDSW